VESSCSACTNVNRGICIEGLNYGSSYELVQLTVEAAALVWQYA
tara:strand:+ start:660 stop:791 length:132 start_codon:yes stop_codon:yes gene_type:complete